MGFDTSAQLPGFGRVVFKSSDVTASSTPESSGEISSCVFALKSPSLTFSWGSAAGHWPAAWFLEVGRHGRAGDGCFFSLEESQGLGALRAGCSQQLTST